MEHITKQATAYISSLLTPLVPKGFELLSEEKHEGISHILHFTVVLLDPNNDYGYVVGYNGSNIAKIRDVIKLWAERNAKQITINVFVQNPRYVTYEK